MGWVQVLSPSKEIFTGMQPLFTEAYDARQLQVVQRAGCQALEGRWWTVIRFAGR